MKITMETLIRENNQHGKQPKEEEEFFHSGREKHQVKFKREKKKCKTNNSIILSLSFKRS